MGYIKQDHIHSVEVARTCQYHFALNRRKSSTFYRSGEKAEEQHFVGIERHYCTTGEKAEVSD